MSINKIVITSGIYQDRELRLLVSFDENDKPTDLINLDITKVGEIHLATVEKVLTDIDACIIKMDSGDKGFIENKKLKPEHFVQRHSEKKLVCQADQFYVQISQDRKGVKPYSCNFLENFSDSDINYSFVDYYVEHYVDMGCEIVSDLEEYLDSNLNIRRYEDSQISLWNLYGLTGILDKVSSKVVHLKSGANLVIEPTEAMTIIDINSSKNYGKSTPMETNLEALEEIARQLRLRSVSGIIIVDLLKVSKEEEQKLLVISNNYAQKDISIVTIHGFTNLGLLEITRSRSFASFQI
ncbi:ribonuclease G [Pseudobutyrivibrio sp. OR37]|uniref:ribonuclease E/G n=1 Tax=Pseudobutyrivibrio sp. OR37 TaxID=1798186 RepID=UPI0008E08BB4|nr:ribonuclease E/G [Pseudobutyrivibrio sp. OR37]SFI02844.1 ribonuclease G [Pseudobutyrivibrio sp. OR37]